MDNNLISWEKQKELSEIIEALFKALWQQAERYDKGKLSALVILVVNTEIHRLNDLMVSLGVPESLLSVLQEIHAIAMMYPSYVASKVLNHIAGQGIQTKTFTLKDLCNLELDPTVCLKDKEYVDLLVHTQIDLVMQTDGFTSIGKYKLLELALNSTTETFYRILDKVWGKLNRHDILFVQTLQQLHEQSSQSLEVANALREYLALLDNQEKIQTLTVNDALQLFYVPHSGWRFHPAIHLMTMDKMQVLALSYKESKTQTITIEVLKKEYEYLSAHNHYFIPMVMQAEKYLKSELPKNQSDNKVIEDIYMLLKGLDSLGAYYAISLALSNILCETGMEISAALLAGYGIACSALDQGKTNRQSLSFSSSSRMQQREKKVDKDAKIGKGFTGSKLRH